MFFMRTWLVYCARNELNGKTYIGQTCRTLETRKKEHIKSAMSESQKGKNIYFHNAIRVHGE